MANRKFYWLKLQKDFFKRHDVKIIEAMENGKDYLLFYLKLLCESVDHEGNLRFSETIPYDDKMLATITGTNVDIVRSAIKVFTGLNMIDILDDQTIFMTEVTKMIGCEGASAERMRKLRASHCDTLVLKSDVEKEIEIDKELDKELDIEKEINNNNNIISPPPKKEVVNNIQNDYHKTPTYEEIKSYFDEYGLNDFEGFYKINEKVGWKLKNGWRGYAVLWSKQHQ